MKISSEIYLRMSLQTLGRPLMAAKWSGVCSSSFLLSMSEPASSNSLTDSTLPLAQEM